MKPNWDDAPEWAKFLCMDDDGSWWWFELKPVWENGNNKWYEGDDGGKSSLAAEATGGELTLEGRS